MHDRSLSLGYCALLLALGVAAILLGYQLGECRRDRTTRDALTVGSYVPPMAVVLESGDSAVVGIAGAPGREILIILNSECIHCWTSLNGWRTLITAASQPESIWPIQVWGLTVEDPSQVGAFLRANDLSIPAVQIQEPRYVSLYSAGTVPQVVVIDGDGKVIYSHRGVLRDDDDRGIWALLRAAGVSSPGSPPHRMTRN